MKIMVASDIHGSALYCRKMLDALEREQADRLLLLGDLLYLSLIHISCFAFSMDFWEKSKRNLASL